ncbi:MAG TPA: TrbG/VirB9 family P-type conjugative transfer protein [Candidatus Binataceae bacterium]|nr:TrbG/VirB9 family P-type conjugative transfer protein [Candidatus Binataceae bacterium]
MKTSIALFGALLGLAVLTGGCATQQPTQPQPAPYIPAALINSPPKHIEVPPDPMAALPHDIQEAIRSGQTHALHEGITTLFPYNAHAQPIINCQVLRVTEIVLNPEESVKADGIGAGDTERWDIKPIANRVLIKPKEPGIETDLIVVSSQRSYHFTLRTRSPYMPQVAFYYPDDLARAEEQRQSALREAARQTADPSPAKPLNFNYQITGPNVPWRPLLAFDDGEHTYVQFPADTLSTDMPTLMVQNGKEQSLVNYQVRGSYYVADRTFQSAALTSGTGTNRQVVQITAR